MLVCHLQCLYSFHFEDKNVPLHLSMWIPMSSQSGSRDSDKEHFLYVKCKYSILIGRFMVTWPSVMLHTDSKYHIERTIFSNIVLSSWCYYLWRHIVLWCHIVLLFDRNVTLVLPSPSWEWPSFHMSLIAWYCWLVLSWYLMS